MENSRNAAENGPLSFQIPRWARLIAPARSRSSRPLGLHFVQAHQPFPKGAGCLARSRSSRPLGLHFVQAHKPFPNGMGCLAGSAQLALTDCAAAQDKPSRTAPARSLVAQFYFRPFLFLSS